MFCLDLKFNNSELTNLKIDFFLFFFELSAKSTFGIVFLCCRNKRDYEELLS